MMYILEIYPLKLERIASAFQANLLNADKINPIISPYWLNPEPVNDIAIAKYVGTNV
jgi:hypothetical protein